MPEIKSIKYLTQDELKRLFAAIESKRDKAIFLLTYYHGLRASEVGNLQVEDVDLSRGRIRILRLKHSQGGEYPMHPNEIKALKAWLKERKNGVALFPSNRGTPIHRRTLDYIMKKYGEKAGLPEDKRHMHVLKHTIATHMLDAGTDIRAVQDWIGHKNIQNTTVYAAISNKARDENAKKAFASPMIVST